MSLYRRFPSEGEPSIVTTNTYERRPLFRRRDNCELLLRILHDVRAECSFHLLAFCLMPDHLHLILVPTKAELGRVMQLTKGRCAGAYNLERDGTGKVWQSRYHERTLQTNAALANAMEYVHLKLPSLVRLKPDPPGRRGS